jgi:23S rRNA (cytosine1962-C5)-methyltransferase
MTPTATVSRRGADRVRAGHPWVYRSDVIDVHAGAGDAVCVKGPRDRVVGQALFSDRSEITLRMLSRDEAPAGEALWRARLARAAAYRRALNPDATAYRLVHGEADLLPSLVVDRYADFLVVQALSQGTDRRLPDLVRMLVELERPAGILARNDPRVRQLEGLEQKVALLHGDVPPEVIVREGGLEFAVDLWKGQKTGCFLDQRENHVAAASYARGRVLDAFSYQGGFALAMARAATEVVALDVSEDAVARVMANAARNGLANVQARAVNVFDELRELERAGASFDEIVLDPPAFAKNKASVPKALSGYKEINLRALKLLAPGGHLITCSCSYNVDEAMFGGIVSEAAADARAAVAVVEKRMQARDHPVLIGFPESYYLKCFVLRKLDESRIE